MHEYTIKNHDRKRIYYSLAVASGILSPFIANSLSQLSSISNLSLIAPSGLAIFSVLFLAFDHLLWKWKLLYDWGVVKIPDLNGDRHGYLVSSSSNSSKEIPVIVTVHQTYSKIRIRLETEKSRSLSLMAAFDMIDPTYFSLRWEYHAEYMPEPGIVKARHYGVTNLILKGKNNRFLSEQKANYYTESGRDTHGRMVLGKVGK